MALAPINYKCGSCGHAAEVIPKRTFLGFLRAACPNCAATEDFPLTKGFRIAYVVILVIMAASMALAASQDEIPLPGLLGLLIITALIIDFRRRKKMKMITQ